MKKHIILITIAFLFILGCARTQPITIDNGITPEEKTVQEIPVIQEATSPSFLDQEIIKVMKKSEEFTIGKHEIRIKKGTNETMYAAVKNPHDYPVEVLASGACANNRLTVPKRKFIVNPGETFVFEYLFNSSKLPALKNMPCELRAYSTPQGAMIGGIKAIYMTIYE